jgi:hypothetical protein
MLRKFFRPTTPNLENSRYATATTPDMLIAGAIVASLAKEFVDWVAGDLQTKTSNYSKGVIFNPTLINTKKGIRIEFGTTRQTINEGYGEACDWRSKGTKVNDTLIELRAARWIARSYETLRDNQNRLKEAAAKAKAEMEANEKKWNLAEQLLDMKRTPTGALVPAKTPCCGSKKECTCTKLEGELVA